MSQSSTKIIKASLCAVLVLLLFNRLMAWYLGWHTFTLLFFWLFLTPLSLHLVPRIWLKGLTQFGASLLACGLFYLIVFLFIYKDYQAQFNNIMLAGALVSMLSLGLLYLLEKRSRKRLSSN